MYVCLHVWYIYHSVYSAPILIQRNAITCRRSYEYDSSCPADKIRQGVRPRSKALGAVSKPLRSDHRRRRRREHCTFSLQYACMYVCLHGTYVFPYNIILSLAQCNFVYADDGSCPPDKIRLGVRPTFACHMFAQSKMNASLDASRQCCSQRRVTYARIPHVLLQVLQTRLSV